MTEAISQTFLFIYLLFSLFYRINYHVLNGKWSVKRKKKMSKDYVYMIMMIISEILFVCTIFIPWLLKPYENEV